MDSRDTRSNAPIPSMDNTVLLGLENVANAFTSSACRCRGPFDCWSELLCDGATNRLMMSPATIPLTPPVGFCSAVISCEQPAKFPLGRLHERNFGHMLQNRSASREDSRTRPPPATTAHNGNCFFLCLSIVPPTCHRQTSQIACATSLG